nr:hypothetical protein [Tanacetum cinerariifolium]
MILFGVDNRPPMLDKDLYDSWKSRMELYMQNREHERMILESDENGLLIWPTIEENGVTRTKKYTELSAAEKIQADCDMKATNIILQGLQADIYSLMNHHKVAKDLWERTKDLDIYDSDCDDISNAKAILMANISNYGSNVILEVPHYETYLNDMENQKQMINHVNNWEKANKEHKSVTVELERYKERVKTFEQRLNIDLSSREQMIDSQMDDMIKEKLALKEQVDSLEQNLSKQIKEKESLLQTFTVFKNESKKENKYMENEIDLEKKLKELDNIIFKVGQSVQTVHMLTKP